MAEGLFRHHIRSAGLSDFSVSSAGLLEGGRAASAQAIAVLGDRGIDLSTHRSRTVDQRIIGQADLALCMERQHLRAAAVLGVGAFGKTFTVKEFVRLGLDAAPRGREEPFTAWLARIGTKRDPQKLLSPDAADEVADPVGGTRRQFEDTAEELDLLMRGVKHLLSG